MSDRVRNIERMLKWGTASVAVVYAIVFFWTLMSNSSARQESGLEIDWAVPTNPQSMIALCLVSASVALWFLRDSGTVFAGLLFVVIVAFFGYWAKLTWGIKVNMGVDEIPNVGPLGNFWIGATFLDVGVFLCSLGLLGLNCWLLVKRLRAKKSAQVRPAGLHPSHS